MDKNIIYRVKVKYKMANKNDIAEKNDNPTKEFIQIPKETLIGNNNRKRKEKISIMLS